MKASRAQTCSIFGLTKYQFDHFVAEGFPATKKGEGRGTDWVVNTAEAHRWLVERAVREAGEPAGRGGPRANDAAEVLSFEDERTRLTKEQADKLERERLLDERRLVPADGVRRLIERLVGGANARLGSIPSKLAPVLRPDDPVTARRHLELAVEEVRAELRRLDVEQAGDEEAA
jgi:phage terminase Nu1 subunit (DNA packaging protein)